MATESVDDLLDEITTDATPSPAIKTSPPVEPTPTRAELLARLKEKKNASRQGRAPKTTKLPSHPLTPIFYCDAPNCLHIMDEKEAKLCPVCQVYCYCSKECQTADWVTHKNMCGKNTTSEEQLKLGLYKEALIATNALYEKTRHGDYITVINEVGEYPSCLFATISEKSNVLHWKQYLKNPLFTTSPFDTLGQLDRKVKAAMSYYPDKKIYIISVLLDRVNKDSNSECICRLYVADSFGQTMANPCGGKVTKTITKYSRKAK